MESRICSKEVPAQFSTLSRQLEFYCRGCDVIECTACMVSEHTNWGCFSVHLTKIPPGELAKLFDRGDKTTLKTSAEHRDRLVQLDAMQDRMGEEKLAESRLIDQHFEGIANVLNARRDHLQTQLEQRCDAHLAPVREIKGQVEQMLEVENLVESVKPIDDRTTERDRLDYIWKNVEIKEKMKKLPKIDEEPLEPNGIQQFCVAEGEFDQLLSHIANFGSIETVAAAPVVPEAPKTPPYVPISENVSPKVDVETVDVGHPAVESDRFNVTEISASAARRALSTVALTTDTEDGDCGGTAKRQRLDVEAMDLANAGRLVKSHYRKFRCTQCHYKCPTYEGCAQHALEKHLSGFGRASSA